MDRWEFLTLHWVFAVRIGGAWPIHGIGLWVRRTYLTSKS